MPRTPIAALILAGGQATRLGGVDKGLIECAGRPLIEHVLYKVRPLVDTILISANRNLPRYAEYGYPVLRDGRRGFIGPLAGIEQGLAAYPTGYVWVIPCDAPAFQPVLLKRLLSACLESQAAAAVPEDAEYIHGTFALLRAELSDSLRAYLDADYRKLQDWLLALPAQRVNCADHPEWFMNINTPEQLEHYARAISTTQ